MLDKVESSLSAEPVNFLDRYREKHNGILPPSVTRRWPYEHIELPGVSQLQEHLESADGPVWAQTWGKKTFFDRTLRVLGVRERELREYVSQLRQREMVDVHQVPMRYNEAGRRTDGYVVVTAKHTTEWGRPVANLWFLGGRLTKVGLEFQQEPKSAEEVPEPHPRITRRPEIFARRRAMEPELAR